MDPGAFHDDRRKSDRKIRRAKFADGIGPRGTATHINSPQNYEIEPVEKRPRGQKGIKERMKELVETNRALSVLARNIGKKWEEIQKQNDWKINARILPIIENLETDEALKKCRSELDVLKSCLLELYSKPSGRYHFHLHAFQRRDTRGEHD